VQKVNEVNIEELVRKTVRDVPDFPKEGIVYKDITPLLEDAKVFGAIMGVFAQRYRGKIDSVAGVESRGFIFGAALAQALGVGLVLIRKPGKLPAATIGVDYELEYGTDRVEMHVDSVDAGERVLLIDDLLATGGTAAAALSLLNEAGAEVVEAAFVIELGFLKGASKLNNVETFSIVNY
jgi:adenine phosphoribosyltransferase